MLDEVDHLLYAVADLETGCDEIEQRLGVRPVRGGRHPAYGTHNALLSLGPTTYLEIIARDPQLPIPERGVLFGLEDIRRSALVTWVLRRQPIDAAVASAASGGVRLGPIQSGHRDNADGTRLSWKLTDPYTMPFDGAVPFLIQWGTTPHPARTAPPGGRLVGLRAEHPGAHRLRGALSALGVEMDVHEGAAFRLVATIRTASGDIELS